MKDQTEKDDRSGASCRYIEATAKGVFIRVRVQPRASRSGIEGVTQDGAAVKVRLTAPPVEGEANSALVDFLSETLGVRKRDLVIVGGQRSRDKRVMVGGLTAAQLMEIFSVKLPGGKKS